jgi:hypothetical protein
MPQSIPPRRNAPLHAEYLNTTTLGNMPGAPRLHPKSQLRALTKSFEAFGQVLPILIDGDCRIISGHAQWEVAKRLGMAEVMVIRIEYRWSQPGSVHYWAMDWRHVVEVGSAGQAVYDRFLNMAVWVKNQPGMGSFYRSQHELFFIFAKGGAPTRNNVQLGRFGRSRSNVWTYPSAASLARTSEEGNPLAAHPTSKNLALICDILLDASIKGDIVIDGFAGSGTTVVAAEKLGRKARAMELDPLYCDTTVRRWQHWTGQDAVRVSDGLTFSALEVEAEGGVL